MMSGVPGIPSHLGGRCIAAGTADSVHSRHRPGTRPRAPVQTHQVHLKKQHQSRDMKITAFAAPEHVPPEHSICSCLMSLVALKADAREHSIAVSLSITLQFCSRQLPVSARSAAFAEPAATQAVTGVHAVPTLMCDAKALTHTKCC